MTNYSERSPIGIYIAIGGFFLIAILTVAMVGCPQYGVYSARLEGEAELAKATQNRQVRIQEANAKMEASKLEAQAEVTKAEGLAKANKILGDSLAGPEGQAYLRYLWITGIERSQHETIYVPTEANLPILESTRRLTTSNKAEK